jgi:hypothetical protein
MDTTFWVGLVLGAILSLLMSVLVNVYNDRIRDALEGRKRIRLNKRREAELRTYRLICDLKQAKPEAYVSFISRQTKVTFYLLYTICFIIFLLAGFFMERLLPPEKIFDRLVLLIGSDVFFLASLATCLQSCWWSRHQATVERKLGRFEEYKKELKRKWGDAAIEP